MQSKSNGYGDVKRTESIGRIMSTVKILDCTLRDGGYINNWEFGRDSIKGIINNLEDAKIDVIECGFLRAVEYNEESSVFSSVKQIKNFISPKKDGVMYVAMIELHEYRSDLLSDYESDGVDGIRLTFRKKEWETAKKVASEIMKKGYKVFIQPVGTCTYSDDDLMSLIKDVNVLKPYGFYLVDTLGMMYLHDIRRLFYLIDNNLSQSICIGFHSHNNLQLSFSNAQEMVRLSRRRTIIIDSSVYGMGRGVGNLATELFAEYLNDYLGQHYFIIPILNIADKYLSSIYLRQRWGYDLPYFISATIKCHPNYASYLMKKQTLSIENIEKILSLIPINERDEYNESLIGKLYFDFQNYSIEDNESVRKLENLINKRDVLIIGLGSSIGKNKELIARTAKEKSLFIISTNFITKDFELDAVFFSNEKRIKNIEKTDRVNLLGTSNLISLMPSGSLVFDYSSLLGEGNASDNVGAMLIRVLKKAKVQKIYLAGFDGFDVDSLDNYYLEKFSNAIDYETAKKKNQEISMQLNKALIGIDYELLTPTKYEI